MPTMTTPHLAPALAAEAERLVALMHQRDQEQAEQYPHAIRTCRSWERQQIRATAERAVELYGTQADVLVPDLRGMALGSGGNEALPVAAHVRGLVPVPWQGTHYAATVQARHLQPGWCILRPDRHEHLGYERLVHTVRDVWLGWKLPASRRLQRKALSYGRRLHVYGTGQAGIPAGQQLRVLIPIT